MVFSTDRLAWLLGELASGDPGPEVMWELPAAVHAAIHPLCLSLVDGPDAAYDAEQETWRRLLEHIAQDPHDPEIGDGADYVQHIARDVCRELEQAEDERRATNLAGLSDEDQAVLGLRHVGRSYRAIAWTLGRGLTAATAQAQHERALHQLRGRAHVEMRQREGWSAPACPELARLDAEARALVQAGEPVTTKLYRDIGKHLDPRGLCQQCQPERERSELAYWWLVAALPPVLAGPAVAAAAKRVRRRRIRNIAIPAAVVVLVAALVIVLVVPGTKPVAQQGVPNPCDLLSQGDVALEMEEPVLACATSASVRVPLLPAGGIKQNAQGTYQSARSVGDAVTVAVDNVGPDSHAGFIKMCEQVHESVRRSDPKADTGWLPGVGEESCYVNSRIAGSRRDGAVVGLAARKGAIVVSVVVSWTQRHDLPTGLTKLALSRVP